MKARSLLVAVTAATSLLVSSAPAALAGSVDSTERALERAGVAAAAPAAVSIHGNVVRAGAIRITLPSTDRTAVVVNGRARLDDAAVRHVVQSTPDDGVQVLAVLQDASAPTRLVYDFGDKVLTKVGNGWVVVSATAGGNRWP